MTGIKEFYIYISGGGIRDHITEYLISLMMVMYCLHLCVFVMYTYSKSIKRIENIYDMEMGIIIERKLNLNP